LALDHPDALFSASYQAEVLPVCKSKLALGEAHTYNPPHWKRCFHFSGGYRKWRGVFGACRIEGRAAYVLENPGGPAWVNTWV